MRASLPHGNGDPRPGILNDRAARDAVRRVQCHRSNPPATQVLSHLTPQHLARRLAQDGTLDVNPQGVVNGRQLVGGELSVKGRADDLNDFAAILVVFHVVDSRFVRLVWLRGRLALQFRQAQGKNHRNTVQ